jgi:hypothetical protein
MSLIYLAGPVDMADATSDVRSRAIKRIVEELGHAIYDATTSFHADARHISDRSIGAVVEVHHSVIAMSHLAIADLTKRSIGIPVEIWEAKKQNIPTIILWDPSDPISLYAEYMATKMAYTWDEVFMHVVTLIGPHHYGPTVG